MDENKLRELEAFSRAQGPWYTDDDARDIMLDMLALDAPAVREARILLADIRAFQAMYPDGTPA